MRGWRGGGDGREPCRVCGGAWGSARLTGPIDRAELNTPLRATMSGRGNRNRVQIDAYLGLLYR